MSMRIERTIEVYLSTRQKILSNLAAGLRQTVDDIPGIIRESVQEIADRSHLKYSTVWAQVTRDMDLSSEQFYDLLQQHLFAPDKRVSRFTHNAIQHIGRDDSIASVRDRLNQ